MQPQPDSWGSEATSDPRTGRTASGDVEAAVTRNIRRVSGVEQLAGADFLHRSRTRGPLVLAN
jgi:hypothetical protein